MKILLPDYEDCQIYGIIRYLQAGGYITLSLSILLAPCYTFGYRYKHTIPTIFACRLANILANMKDFASKH